MKEYESNSFGTKSVPKRRYKFWQNIGFGILSILFGVIFAIFGLYTSNETIREETESAQTRFREELQSINKNTRFLVELSVFRNAITFKSSLPVNNVLQEYFKNIAGQYVSAMVVTDEKFSLFSSESCASEACSGLNASEMQIFAAQVQKLVSQNRFDPTIVDMKIRDQKYVIFPVNISESTGIKIGVLWSLINTDILLAKVIPKRLSPASSWEVSLTEKSLDSLAIKQVPASRNAALSEALMPLITSSIFLVLFSYTLFQYLNRKFIEPLIWFYNTLKNAVQGGSIVTLPQPRFKGIVSKICDDLNSVLKRLSETQKQLLDAESRAAVARTTRMLAHDLKSPFSRLHTVLNLFKKAETIQDIRQIAAQKIPEIETSILRIETLISDILAYSNSMELKLSHFSLDELIATAIDQTKTAAECNNIEFSVKVDDVQLYADKGKLSRALLNVLKNAVEAQDGCGTISIQSSNHRTDGISKVTLRIQNKGPLVPQEDLLKVFDSFYTNKKTNGTGLGLAITKTFIESHQGQISCHSSDQDGVIFQLTIPLEQQLKELNPSEQKDRHDATATSELPTSFKRFVILIVEDDQTTLNDLREITLSKSWFSVEQTQINTALTVDDAILKYNESVPDLVFLDLDLGKDSENGIGFLNFLREKNSKAVVCVHSNQPEDLIHSEVKPDLVVSKPMTAEKFTEIATFMNHSTEGKNPIVAVLDDEAFYLSSWADSLQDATVLKYQDHELFWDEVIDNKEQLSSISMIILDYYFPGTNIDQLRLVRSMRNRNYNGAIVLSTNAPVADIAREPIDCFNLITDKQSRSYWELSKLILEEKQKSKDPANE